MKKLEIIIRPKLFTLVRAALMDAGAKGLNCTEIKGFGRQQGFTEVYRGATLRVDCVPKTKIEVVLEDEQVEATIEAVLSVARTGQVGDGKIFVSNVLDAVRIRTGERGNDAL